ncbi:hypothetical protein [Erythrobacter sp. EC-HK427]|uniref:hypothetical protein n=1 Tax=Erythrobacter sp. EC-HK427 TaxID=2038396 RepID=UPI00125266E5|nr:hypothetical protein [Erythrobacter sp. EC-HK427]VVT13872.1 membrane hypothetical protein [Erythrobacter sp. EC-HK427]
MSRGIKSHGLDWFFAIALIGLVCGLYLAAPCTTFDPFFVEPNPFFAYAWPLSVPLIIVWAMVGRRVVNGKLRLAGWIMLFLFVLAGWFFGFVETYIWWHSNKASGAPWPEFC